MHSRLSVVALLVGAAAAHADYWCEKGYRDTTAAERATQTRALETIRAALPAAPAGWTVLGDDKISVLQSLCADFDGAPWRYEFNRDYQSIGDRDQREALITQAAAIMKTDQAAKQAQLDAIMAKVQTLGAEAGAAAQAGDFAKVDAISQENAELMEQYQQLADGGPGRERADALLVQASRDQTMHISVRVNALFEPPEGAAAYPSPTGARSAHRWSDQRDTVAEDHIAVLFGQPPSDAATTTPAVARSLLVEVTADAGRIDATVAAIDFVALAGVLSQ